MIIGNNGPVETSKGYMAVAGSLVGYVMES